MLAALLSALLALPTARADGAATDGGGSPATTVIRDAPFIDSLGHELLAPAMVRMAGDRIATVAARPCA